MPLLRREFYSTLGQMLQVVNEPLLTDRLPSEDPHNVSARVLRLGLAISAFASLEKYLAARMEAVAQALSASTISPDSLTSELRAFLSVEAILGLANQLNFEDAANKQNFADDKLAQLAKYSAVPPTYVGFGFSPKGSNVAEADIVKALKAFGIEKVWDRLAGIASNIGAGPLSLKNNFNNLAKTRHRSAHKPASNIPSSDLKTHIETSILVAVCFDCLTISIVRSMTSASNYTQFKAALDADVLKYCFVDREISGDWVERAADGITIRKRSSDEATALAAATGRRGSIIVVQRDEQGVPLAVV
ncbi:MAG: hypothetical protein KGL63_07820 [Betaproteobacteria bacterium]|nr:hypothetical protein [Betaproteobacteria bacterium]